MIQGTGQRHATMLAYLDNFHILGYAILAMIPTLFLMKKTKSSGGMAVHYSGGGEYVPDYHAGARVSMRLRRDRQRTCPAPELGTLGPLSHRRIAKQAQVDCGTVRHCEERIDGTFYRLAKAFWRGSYERSMSLDARQTFDADCMVKMMEGITENIAAEGDAVVVGRGAPSSCANAPTLSGYSYTRRGRRKCAA